MHGIEVAFYALLLISFQLHLFECQPPKGLSSSDELKYLKEAGCGNRGELLDIGVCTKYGYGPHITPKVGNITSTDIYTTITYQNIRDVDDKKGTVE